MLKLNTPLFHRALGSAVIGNIDKSDIVENLSRNVDTAIGHDSEALPESQFQHLILVNGKTSAKGVEIALSKARQNQETELIPALEKIQDAINSHGETPVNLSMYEAIGKLADRIELARLAPLAKCPSCNSHDVIRNAAKSSDEGPMETCTHCNNSFPMKPGTTTVFKYGQQFDSSEPDEEHIADEEAPAEVKESDVAYDPSIDEEADFTNTPALPDGSPNSNFYSDYAKKMFGITTSA